MKRDLLLEIGLEEMPSSFMGKTLNDLKELAERKFSEKRIKYDLLDTMGTPRRMLMHLKGVDEKQEDALIENRGPKRKSAFDAEGNPTKAAMGFARGQGVDVSELEIRELNGIEYLFATKTEIGASTSELLPELLMDILNSLSFPKSMRWGAYHTRFARPVRWLLPLYGEELLPLQVENVKSESFTMGHRFLAPDKIEIKSIEQYFQALRDSYVILDQRERKQLIWKQVQEAARQTGGEAMENEELLDEITYLVEYPTAFYGEFSSSYLDVPPEVLTTSMIEHQRYFPVFDMEQKLMPMFIGVRNGTDYSINMVKAGNERVLKARLEDALFFWKEDTKRPVEELVPKLEAVLYHERLGTVMVKVKRLQDLAQFIGEKLHISTKERLERAAFLCKADLMSNMVYEFPELQGIMGRYYAQKSGEEREVSEAIFEHYLPRFVGDELPQSPTGIALSLAEKIDNLVGCFSIGIKPTGSQDPYALRRQALGIENIIMDLDLHIDLTELIAYSYDSFTDVKADLTKDEIVRDLMEFIKQRMRGTLLDKGLSYDVIDAVLYSSSSDLSDILLRAEKLQEFKNNSLFADLMVVFNRSNNLSKKWDSHIVDSKVLIDDSEKELYAKYLALKDNIDKHLNNNDYDGAMMSLAQLRPAIDAFFEAVMVMVEDEELKASRLGILKSIAELCKSIADFSKIVE